ncbi:MAG: hypothetical protein HGA59_00905 [Chlorobiaceae bacterium]|nr:hypothetical protein [Chlorobiaceae bacterium]NTV17504.1 hypothetical protein [Chlorobiaceae bacterium]
MRSSWPALASRQPCFRKDTISANEQMTNDRLTLQSSTMELLLKKDSIIMTASYIGE